MNFLSILSSCIVKIISPVLFIYGIIPFGILQNITSISQLAYTFTVLFKVKFVTLNISPQKKPILVT